MSIHGVDIDFADGHLGYNKEPGTFTLQIDGSEGKINLVSYDATLTKNGIADKCLVFKTESGKWYEPFVPLERGNPATIEKVKELIDIFEK